MPDVGFAKSLRGLFRPPRLCFLLARFAWTLLTLAAPVSVAVCYGLFAAGFLMWSFAALPIAVTMVVWTRRGGFGVQSRNLWVFGAWLSLLALVGGVALAGDRIHWNAFWHGVLQVLYGLSFIAIVVWAFWHLARADAHLRRGER